MVASLCQSSLKGSDHTYAEFDKIQTYILITLLPKKGGFLEKGTNK